MLTKGSFRNNFPYRSRGFSRFYFAKDSVLRPDVVQAYLGEETIGRFRALKRRCDPEGLLATNLWRRVFATVT